MAELVSGGCLTQMNAEAFRGLLSGRRARALLRRGQVDLLEPNCHNLVEAWIYAGRSDSGSDPQDREDAILTTEPTSLEGVSESNTLGFPYPSIVIENESYTYDKNLEASNTYKIVLDNLVYQTVQTGRLIIKITAAKCLLTVTSILTL